MKKHSVGQSEQTVINPDIVATSLEAPAKSRKKLIIVFLAVLVLITSGVIGYFEIRDNINQKNIIQKNKEANNQWLQATVGKPIPEDDQAKFYYYQDLATGYADVGKYKEALEAMQKADALVKDRSATAPYSANLGMAYIYSNLGNKSKAKEFYQKEIDRIKSIPDNANVVQSIQDSMKAQDK